MTTIESDEIILEVNSNIFISFMKLIPQTGVMQFKHNKEMNLAYEKDGLEYLGLNIYGTDIHLFTKKK